MQIACQATFLEAELFCRFRNVLIGEQIRPAFFGRTLYKVLYKPEALEMHNAKNGPGIPC
jgi:hypothetical protein